MSHYFGPFSTIILPQWNSLASLVKAQPPATHRLLANKVLPRHLYYASIQLNSNYPRTNCIIGSWGNSFQFLLMSSNFCACVCPQGSFTWNSVSGRSVGLKPVPLQSLSELERVRLQDVAFRRLLRDRNLGCHVTIPKCTHTQSNSFLCVTVRRVPL